jgi:hypothetical protein
MLRTFLAFAFLLAIALGLASSVAAGVERVQTATGSVARLEAADRTVYLDTAEGEMRFIWTSDTRINGTLAVGARVTVRYTTQSDGSNVALQISVART